MCNKEVIPPGECFLLTEMKYSVDYKTFRKCQRRLSSQTSVLLLRSFCAAGLCPSSPLSAAFLPRFLAMARQGISKYWGHDVA